MTRSKKPKAVTRLALWNRLSRHVRKSPCLLCGAEADHAHHLLTRGAYIELFFCLLNLTPLCARCHAMAHGSATEQREFKRAIEAIKPGIYDRLRSLSKSYFKRDLGLIEQEIAEAEKRPFHEFFRSIDIAA